MKGQWSRLAGVGLGGIVLVHCGTDHAAPASSYDEASVASARVAELRTRFGLPAPAVERFDVIGTRAVAVIPDSRRGNRPARVGLPLRADREVEIEDEASHVGVRFALQGTSEAKMTWGGGMALYAGALDGADVVQRVFGEGTEDFVAFERQPSHEQLRYAVDVSRVAGLRLVSRTLEFLDESGTPVSARSPRRALWPRDETCIPRRRSPTARCSSSRGTRTRRTRR